MTKRQSNKREFCPVCFRRLDNRAAAVSHYRTHVKEGTLEERKHSLRTQFRQVGLDDVFEVAVEGGDPNDRFGWFTHGIPYSSITCQTPEDAKRHWTSWRADLYWRDYRGKG